MKKIYEKPLMTGHKLQHHAGVLALSNGEADGYGMSKRLYVPKEPYSETDAVDEAW